MKRIQSQQQRQHEKEQIRSENHIQMSIEKEKMLKEETRMRIHSKEIEKHAMWRKERERVAEEDRKKKEEIEERM